MVHLKTMSCFHICGSPFLFAVVAVMTAVVTGIVPGLMTDCMLTGIALRIPAGAKLTAVTVVAAAAGAGLFRLPAHR